MKADHEYHALTVEAVIDETGDTRSFVLDIPAELADTFAYEAGQFCTFRATVDGHEVHIGVNRPLSAQFPAQAR